MELSNDELRRELRDVRREQAEAMGPLRELLGRLLEDPGVSAADRAQALAGPLARRRFLQLGGLSVASAAVLAACGGQGGEGAVPIAGTSPSTTKAPTRTVTDSTYLRTSSSLEYSAIDAYDRALALGVLPAALADVAKTFRDQHAEHAELFSRLTSSNGGKPFDEVNPVVQAAIVVPAFALAAKDGNKPEDIVQIAFGVENLAAETYQQFTPLLTKPGLRGSIMSVGGIEARHAAVLAKAIPGSLVVPAQQQPPDATATTVAPGATTTTEPDIGGAADLAPVFQVPGAFQPLTSVQITIGIETLNADPLGPNSYMYEYNEE